MIIYHTVSTYHILRSILHKLNYRREQEAVLMIPSLFLDLPEGIKNGSDIFVKIIKYDWEFIKFGKYPTDVYEYIDSTLKKDLGTDYLEKVEEFNIFYAARFFGAFLADRGIHFNWFEEADGRYVNYFPPMRDDERLHFERYKNAVRLGLYTAENDCIDKIYLSLDDNPGICETGKIKQFDVNDELGKLEQPDITRVLHFWNADKRIDVPPESAMLMSQHFCNIKIMSFEEQVLMYQMFVDYFLEGKKLFLKMHPSDNFPYLEFINDITRIDANYPAELLQFVLNGKFDVAAAVSSTGVYNMKAISDKQFCINQDYTFDYRDTDKFLFALKVCMELSINTVICKKKPMELLKVLAEANAYQLEFCNEVCEGKQSLILITENMSQEEMAQINNNAFQNNIWCFISHIGFDLAHNINMEKCVAKKIITETLDGKEILDEKLAVIFTNDANIIDRIGNMEYYKMLKNTKIAVRVDKDDDKDIQINILNAMLDATEKALIESKAENEAIRKKYGMKEQ